MFFRGTPAANTRRIASRSRLLLAVPALPQSVCWDARFAHATAGYVSGDRGEGGRLGKTVCRQPNGCAPPVVCQAIAARHGAI